jgi:hypothetical protein
MLTIWGSPKSYCDGINRRNFLKIGALGAGLTLADLLRLRSQAASSGRTPTRNKAAIMIYLPGGPSHMDMYDLKPDAPAEFRGEFRPIRTNVPGCQVCEHMPLQAHMWDKLAAIRSIVSVGEHSDSLVMTGHSARDNMIGNWPSFGGVISRLRGQAGTVPPFVSLRGMTRGTEPGFLGVAHRPFVPSGPGVDNLRMANGLTAERVGERRSLLEGFDAIRRDVDASGTVEGMDNFTQRAFDIIASGGVRHALDLTREESRIRARYRGVEQFLTARRLIEAGVGCVTLAIGSWDTHGQNFNTLRRQLPQVDRGVANLVEDLHDRGLADDVVVIMWGEFGRTPRVNNNAGRDHWPQVMSALIAGGGLRTGQMVGSSSARGERPQDRPCTVQQVLATIYHALGIDPAQTFVDNAGRPRYILDDRAPIRELLA